MNENRNFRVTPNHPILNTKYRYEIPSSGRRLSILADQTKAREKDKIARELQDRLDRIDRETFRSKWEENDECKQKWIEDRQREKNRHLHLLEQDFLKARKRCLKGLLDCEQKMYEKELAEMGFCIIKH